MRLGQWGVKMDAKAYDHFVRGCIDLGFRDFDHADIYGDYTTESEFGEILRKDPALRKQMQITTKCGIRMMSDKKPFHNIKSYDSSKAHIIESVECSLKNLNTDYIDILLIHRPDLLLEPKEVAEAIFELKKNGKVLFFGVSNFSISQFKMLNAEVDLCTNQVEASVLKLDAFHDGTLDQLLSIGMQPTIWSPLAGGAFFLTEKDERVLRILKEGKVLCQKYNCDMDTLLLAWTKRHPSSPVPVLGTSKIERIEKYANKKVNLEREDWYKLYTASLGHKVA